MMLKLKPTADFYFDREAADRPVRFVQKFCIHYEGKHAGKPFILHPIQKRIVRDLYGWKWKSTELRRFTDCYFEGAVGSGKSPLLAALGLYGLMADGEQGAQVYSLASSFGQARVVFDTAKRFAANSSELSKRLEIVDREIRHPKTGSFWQVVSGKGPGAGCKPSLILGDEVHQWSGAGAYQDLRDRMFKRERPLLIAATNAGRSRASFCWQLREKAVAALKGKGEKTLYPIIWAAPETARTDNLAALRAANPLIGTTIPKAVAIRNAREAMADPADDANFRRLNLGIWPKAGGGRWLDLSAWDACQGEIAPPADAPLYIGLDLSQGDDLCAATFNYVTPAEMIVDAKFWLPLSTAAHYAGKDGIPYLEWGESGHIELLEELTISPAVKHRIAANIIAIAKTRKVKAVCYDRYKADEVIAALEAAGLTCVPVPQGYTVSPGCNELERRLKERSIIVTTNPVLRWCAENTEVKQDDRGNIWPVKPNARGKYAGKRGLKIDGITALVTCMTEARKHTFPAAKKKWHGSATLI
jgi:phage terminase large subunit-like protein